MASENQCKLYNSATLDYGYFIENEYNTNTVVSKPVITDISNQSFEVVKNASKINIKPGEIFSYTISIINTGNSELELVDITDDLPSALELIENSVVAIVDDIDTDISVTTSPLTFTFPENTLLASEKTASITFKVKFNDLTGQTTNFNNTATINVKGLDPKITNPVPTTVKYADVSIKKETTAVSPLHCGDSFSYILTIENKSDDIDAVDVVVRDYFDRAFILDTADDKLLIGINPEIEHEINYIDNTNNGLEIAFLKPIPSGDTVVITIPGKLSCCTVKE